MNRPTPRICKFVNEEEEQAAFPDRQREAFEGVALVETLRK
jgi:hypothetical protein